jgi:hypothetical protein
VLTINWCAAAVLLAAAYVVCYSIPLSDLAPDPTLAHLHVVARSIAMLLLTLSALSAVLLVVAVIACLRDPEVSGRYIAWVGFACATPFLSYVVVSLMTWPMHRHALERAAKRGAAVIDTVECDAPPDAASTSLAAYPTFTFTRFAAKDAKRTLWWYDLGGRHGRSVTATWAYPDGEVGHAILAVEIDGEDNVALTRGDRLSLDVRPAQFDTATWNAKTQSRQAMVHDIIKHTEHASRADVQALLGPPDGTRTLVDTPWQLAVRTLPNDIDLFFYWPTHAYPTVLDGRGVTRVGDWAYARN